MYILFNNIIDKLKVEGLNLHIFFCHFECLFYVYLFFFSWITQILGYLYHIFQNFNFLDLLNCFVNIQTYFTKLPATVYNSPSLLLTINPFDEFLQCIDLHLDAWLSEGVIILNPVQEFGGAPETVCLDGIQSFLG